MSYIACVCAYTYVYACVLLHTIQTIIQSYVFYMYSLFFLLLEIPRFLYRSFLRQSPPHIDAAQALLQPHGSRLRPEISKPKPHGVSENRLSIAHDRDNMG